MKKAGSPPTARAVPSPARIAAGRRNRQLGGPLTDAGRVRLREAALRHRPWAFATGPRTPTGKAKVALNGKRHRKGALSVRERRRLLKEVEAVRVGLSALRRQALCPQAAATPP